MKSDLKAKGVWPSTMFFINVIKNTCNSKDNVNVTAWAIIAVEQYF